MELLKHWINIYLGGSRGQSSSKSGLINPLFHDVEKWPNIHTLKILRCEHRKIFKVC